MKKLYLIAALFLPLAAIAQTGPPAATSTNQVNGLQKAQQVDASGNVAPAGDTAGRAVFVQQNAQPLPAGAATAAKQPALGTAGASSTDVLSVQGVAGGTPQPVVGSVAAAATDSGNPLKIGGIYNTTFPTLTDGQRGNAQQTARGSLIVTLYDQNGTNISGQQTTASDAGSAQAASMRTSANCFVFNGTSWDRCRGDTNGQVVQSWAMAPSRWAYPATSGGISNTTTAVTLAAAAGASVRNYLTAIQIDSDTLGAASEIVVRDGAGGTVLWRGKLQTTATSKNVTFSSPLKGTANTLMEFATLTASVTGSVYVNAQGFQGP